MKILMVCLGNICRSPLAEGILKEKVRLHNLPWEVDSAGTGSWHVGDTPDRRSVAVAKAHSIDILDQRARQFQPQDLDRFDLILTMDASNYRNVLQHADHDEHRDKVQMIMDFVHPEEAHDVPDPYWDDDGFEGVYQMLDEACERIVERFAVSQ